MRILILYMPLEIRVQDFVRLVQLLKHRGFRIAAAEFTDKDRDG